MKNVGTDFLVKCINKGRSDRSILEPFSQNSSDSDRNDLRNYNCLYKAIDAWRVTRTPTGVWPNVTDLLILINSSKWFTDWSCSVKEKQTFSENYDLRRQAAGNSNNGENERTWMQMVTYNKQYKFKKMKNGPRKSQIGKVWNWKYSAL